MGIEEILKNCSESFLKSELFGIIIIDKEYNIVWHNDKFSKEYTDGRCVVGDKCYQALGDEKPHAECPTRASLQKNVSTKQLIIRDNSYFVSMAFPVSDGYAAHIYSAFDKGKIDVVEEIMDCQV